MMVCNDTHKEPASSPENLSSFFQNMHVNSAEIQMWFLLLVHMHKKYPS